MPRASGVPVREFSVYIHLRKQRPKKVATLETSSFPETWSHDGKVYYFTTADLTERTLTYSDVRPIPATPER